MDLLNWLSDNYLEVFGAVTGILYVFLEIKQNPLLWPVGIITSGVYIYVFYSGKLYADMCLQTYYVVISIFGWYWWVRRGHKDPPLKSQSRQDAERDVEMSQVQTAEPIVFPPLKSQSRQNVGRARGMLNNETPDPENLPPLKSQSRQNVGRDRGMLNSESPADNTSSATPVTEPASAGTLQVTRLRLRTGVYIASVFALLWAVMWQVLAGFTDSPVPIADSFITSLSVVATWMLARKIYEHWYLWIVVNFSMVLLCAVRGMYPTLVLYIVYGAMSFEGLREWAKTIADPGEKQ